MTELDVTLTLYDSGENRMVTLHTVTKSGLYISPEGKLYTPTHGTQPDTTLWNVVGHILKGVLSSVLVVVRGE